MKPWRVVLALAVAGLLAMLAAAIWGPDTARSALIGLVVGGIASLSGWLDR